MDVNVTARDTEAFLAALRAAAKDRPMVIHVWLSTKEDALADAKLALDMSYGGGVSICRALVER